MRLSQCLVEVGVYRGVLVAGEVAPAAGVVELVHLDGGVGTPAPLDGALVLMQVELVPAAAFGVDLNADLTHLVGPLHGDALTGRVAGGVVQVEGAAHAVLGTDAVARVNPTGVLKNLAGFLEVGLAHHVLARPGQAVAHGEGGRTIAVEDVGDEAVAVGGVVERATDGNVAGDVVALGVVDAVVALGGTRRHAGQRHAARVDGGAGEQFIACRDDVVVGGGGVGDVDLAGLRGGDGGVLLHEDDHDALHLHGLAVVVGVGLEDDLLALVPLLEHVAAAADGVRAVVGAVGVLGHDAHDGKRVEQGVEWLVEAQLNGGVVDDNGLVDHGEVGLGGGAVDDAVDGEGHVAGGEGLAVGELDVVADGERPGQAVLGALIGGGEVVLELEVEVGGDERRLDERLMHVLAAAPAHKWVEAGGRLRAGGHGEDDLRGGVALCLSWTRSRKAVARRERGCACHETASHNLPTGDACLCLAAVPCCHVRYPLK